MPLTTLGTVERMGLTTLTSPCSSCFARLKHAEHAAARTGAALIEGSRGAAADAGEGYGGTVRVQHLLDTLMERVGMDGIAGRVERPPTGLKVACYYGCLITRPVKVTGAEHHEYPMKMDYLLQALGAESVGWSAKADCCGGVLGVVKTDVSVRLARRVLADARASGADLVVIMCPMCHLNLDARQQRMGFEVLTPIVHATQLMVLAFDLGEQPRCSTGTSSIRARCCASGASWRTEPTAARSSRPRSARRPWSDAPDRRKCVFWRSAG